MTSESSSRASVDRPFFCAAFALFLAWAAFGQETVPTASQAAEAARAAIRGGEFQKAFDILKPAFERNRNDVEINLLLVDLYLADGDLKAARRHSDQAQAVAPKDPRGAVSQGHVMFRMGEAEAAAHNPLSRASYTEAAIAYEEALKLGAPPYEASFWAADSRARARQWPEALANARRASQVRPGDLGALTLEGRILIDSDRPAEGARLLAGVLENGPGTPAAGEAAPDLVRAYLKLDDMASLPPVLQKIVIGNPHGAEAPALQLAWDSLHGSKNENVWAFILESLAAAQPDDPLVAYYRAELAVRRGPPSDALALAERYSTSRPTDPNGYAFRAVALRQLGRLDEARQVLGKAYDLDSQRESTLTEYRYLVAAFFGAKRYREAADIQELVVHMSGTPADRHDYAVLRLDAGAKDVAERLYRELAADMNIPESERSRAWNALALLLRSQGRIDESEKAFRSAVSDDPANLDAHENLGILLLRKGAVEDGKRELALAVARNADPAPRKRSLYHLWRASHPEVP